MRPTDILKQEHRVIEQVLACLERMAERCEAGETLDAGSARDAVAFLRTFADQCHHGKEEDCLFPALEALGFPRQGGPTGVMLHEHEQGRAFIAGMEGAIGEAVAGDAGARAQWVRHARGYANLLRQHIQKEDHCLFAMADQALPDAEQQRLLEAFGRVEHEDMGPGTHEKYLKIADALADRYGVPRAVTAAGQDCGCSCGH